MKRPGTFQIARLPPRFNGTYLDHPYCEPYVRLAHNGGLPVEEWTSMPIRAKILVLESVLSRVEDGGYAFLARGADGGRVGRVVLVHVFGTDEPSADLIRLKLDALRLREAAGEE